MEMTIQEFLDSWDGHPAIKAYLWQIPEVIDCPIESMELGRKYPSPDNWRDFDRILTLTDSWGDEEKMTLIAKHFLGQIVAVTFSKFYEHEWPRILRKNNG